MQAINDHIPERSQKEKSRSQVETCHSPQEMVMLFNRNEQRMSNSANSDLPLTLLVNSIKFPPH